MKTTELRSENAKLAKQGLKRCKYCLEVKEVTNYKKVGKHRIKEYCIDCTTIYKEEKRKYDKEYYLKNKEKKQVYYKKWKANGGQELRRLNDQKREAKKKNVYSDLTIDEWEECLKYFDYSCAYCGMKNEDHIEKYGHRLHQDHIIPLSKDGAYSKFNIVPACLSCNSSKNDMDLEDFFMHNKIFKLCSYIYILDYFLGCI